MDAPKRIWKCAGCGLQMPGTCECVTNVAVSWEPDHISAWKHELRLETGMENIARDMAEGRFPERSDPLVVRMNPDQALAASPEVAKLVAEAEALGMERAAERCDGWCGDWDGEQLGDAIRAEAAAIRRAAEETGT